MRSKAFFFGIFLAPIAALILLLTLFVSNLFIIEYITVESTSLDPTTVRSILFSFMDEHNGFFTQKYIFFFKPSLFREYLSHYARIEELNIRKQYPKTLSVKLSASPFHVIGYIEGHFYELSPDGSLRDEVDATALPHYPSMIQKAIAGERVVVKKDTLSQMDLSVPIIFTDPRILQQNVSPSFSSTLIAHIESLKHELRHEKFVPLFFQVTQDEYTYYAFTNEGWYLKCTTQSDVSSQVDRLKNLLNTKIKKKRKNLDYIDIRFDNHLFYTFRPS